MRPGLVVSGGQTGADRAALDAAVATGLPYAGWCPAGGWAEDMPVPPGLLAAYPGLRETDEPDPDVRTRLNVRDSDAVLVLHLADLGRSPGTLLTVAAAESLGRPLLAARADRVDDVAEVERWSRGLPAGCSLDVAGPRESEDPGLYAAAYRLLLTLWTR